MRWSPIALAVGIGLLGVGPASAADQTCDRVAAETITVDGALDDWAGFRGRRIGAKKADRGLVVRCAYDRESIYLALLASDDRVIRGSSGDAKREDWVGLELKAPGGKAVTVRVFPGTRGFKPKIVKPKWVEALDSLQPTGFSVEVAIPLKKISKWTPSLPALTGRFRFGDTDKSSAGASVLSGKLRLQFSDAAAVYKSFLRSAGLSRSDIRYDVLRDVDLGKGAERVVAGGNVIGVLSDSFVYMRLPVASASDVLKVRVVNFSGSGRGQILAHYRQHGNGSRDVVAVWNIDSDQRFEKLLAVEVRKEHEGKIITSEWSLKRAGSLRAKPAKTKKRGYDLVIEAGEAVGFSASNYREARSVDEDSILLPWSDPDSRIYFFDGDSLEGSEAMDAKKRAARKKAAAKKRTKKK